MMGINGHLEASCLQHEGRSQLLRWGRQGKWTHIFIFYLKTTGASQGVQWLRLRTSSAGGVDMISGRRTKNPHAAQCGQKIINFLNGISVEKKDNSSQSVIVKKFALFLS